MTGSSTARCARGLCLGLLLGVASADAFAGELYRWVTEDGRVEIGPLPPPGASAVPWRPGQDQPALPTPAAARPPAARTEPAPIRAPKPGAGGSSACARSRESARRAAQQVIEAEAEITRLEQRIETLEASEVAYSRTTCRSRGIYGPKSDCVSSRFDRDAEIESAEQALEAAKERLGDLELHARRSADSEACPAAAD